MIEMRNSPFIVHHLEHPRPVHWGVVVETISKALHLPVVSFSEWLDRLEMSGRTITCPEDLKEMKRRNPAWSLVALFRLVKPHRSEAPWRRALGQPVMDMSHSLTLSPALGEKNLPPLDEEDALKWLHFWKQIGILDWHAVHANL